MFSAISGLNSVNRYESVDLEAETEHLRSASYDSNYSYAGIKLTADFASEYDLCLVLPSVDNGTFTATGYDTLQLLQRLGFELFLYHGSRSDEIIVMMRAPIEVLQLKAESLKNFKLPLDPDAAERALSVGNEENGINSTTIPHRPDITTLLPFDYIYANYNKNVSELLYFRPLSVNSPFHSDIVKLKLEHKLLKTKLSNGNLVVDIDYLRMTNAVKACFPLHNLDKHKRLAIMVTNYPFRKLPIDEIRDYFGETIGLYFAFIDHFIRFLFLPGLIGIPAQVVFSKALENNKDLLFLRPAYSLLIVIWAVCMLELWKRKEKYIALKWGTIGFETTEEDRSQFTGKWERSYINGQPIRYYPQEKRILKILQSTLPILVMILLAIGIVASIYIIRYTVQPKIGPTWGQVFASATNTVQIQIMNSLYGKLAKYLSERENHRTNTDYEDSMIAKMFAFQFVNSYASFFYLAFIAESVGHCPVDGCMGAIALNLIIVFGTRLVVSNWFQIAVPYFDLQKRQSELARKGAGRPLYRPEKEYLLDEYDQLSARLGDYGEVVIGFGYTAMFLSALPSTATCLLLSLVIGLKGDIWRLLNLHKRTFPEDCEDIGTWQYILLFLTIAAVITNAGLVVFTMHELRSFMSLTARYWLFIGFQWLCFFLMIVLMELIPDTPRCVKIQLERTEFIVSKLIDRIPDSESMIKTIKHNSSNNSSTNSSEKSTNNSLLNARDKNKKSKKLIQISQYPQEL